MTATTILPLPITSPSLDPSLKVSDGKEVVRARRASFLGLKTLSNSFSKQRCSHNRHVHFDLDSTRRYDSEPIDDTVRSLLWTTYSDKVSSADDVEETCYNFTDSDFVHPYVQQLDDVWNMCGLNATAKESAIKPLPLVDEDLGKLTDGKGRGLEKKLMNDLRRNKEQVLRQVVDAHKSYKNLPLPAEQKAKLLRNKCKKLSAPFKIFALTMAQADAQIATKLHGKPVAATSA